MKSFKKVLVSIFLVLCTFLFVACLKVPDTLNKGFEKMENQGYEVTKMTADDIADTFGGLKTGANAGIVCEKETEEEALFVIWFTEKEQAEDFKSVFNMMKEQLQETFDDKEVEYKQEGKVFYFGTKGAVKDFTK